jgi:predicted secreted protein
MEWDASTNKLGFAGSGGMSIGTSGSKKSLVTTVPEIAVWSTSALTSGTQDIVKIDFTQTAAATSGYIKGIRCTMTSDVKTPGSFNAIKGIIDYQTDGHAHGDCAPLAAELTMPNSSAPRGTFYLVDLQVSAGASSAWTSAGPLSFVKYGALGTKTQLDAEMFLFDITGFTGAAGAFLGANQNTVKVRVEGTTQYMMLSEYEDTLSIGLTGAKKTLVTGVPEIAIWSTSALTSGTQDVMKIDYTHTSAATSGYVKGLRCTMTSNVKTPGSFNALKGIIDYQTNGHAHGDAGCVASELIPPNSSATRGTFSCFEAQVVPGASSAWNSAGPLSFLRCILSGTATHFDDYGYLFTIEGCNSGSGHFWYDNTDGAYDEWIKVKTPSGDRYIPLMDGQAA